MMEIPIKQKPCKQMIESIEQLQKTELKLFLERDNVKKMVLDIRDNFYEMLNDRPDGFDHVEFERALDCVQQTVVLAKNILKERAFEAAKVYHQQAAKILSNAEEIENIDEALNDALKDLGI